MVQSCIWEVLQHVILNSFKHFLDKNLRCGEMFFVSFEPVKEKIETRRESRKASKEEWSAEAPSLSGSPKWDSTPQNIWLSDSIPATSVLKWYSLSFGPITTWSSKESILSTCGTTCPSLVTEQSKIPYTGTNFIFQIIWTLKQRYIRVAKIFLDI